MSGCKSDPTYTEALLSTPVTYIQLQEHNFTTLSLSSLQIITDTFANSANLDETTHNDPSHQNLHCLPLLLILD